MPRSGLSQLLILMLQVESAVSLSSTPDYITEVPPSTISMAPVTNDASFEASHRTG